MGMKTRRCPRCHCEMEGIARFCPRCGQPLRNGSSIWILLIVVIIAFCLVGMLVGMRVAAPVAAPAPVQNVQVQTADSPQIYSYGRTTAAHATTRPSHARAEHR